MPMLNVTGSLDLQEPQLVIAISGWVDGGLVATQVGECLTALGEVVATFSPDGIYDYRSNRPTVEFAYGSIAGIDWPSLGVLAARGSGDVLVLAGLEPDIGWEAACDAIAALAESTSVRRVISVGAVPAAVAHTRPTPVMVTSTDPEIEASGLPNERFSVPGAFVNVVAHRVASRLDIPEVGFWAQVPHYVSGVYWPGVTALVSRIAPLLGLEIDQGPITESARDQIERLDAAVAGRPDAQELVRQLEESTPAFILDEDFDVAGEVEAFLRRLGENE